MPVPSVTNASRVSQGIGGGGNAQIDGLPGALSAACRQLCDDIRQWEGTREVVSDRSVGFRVGRQSVCQLHAKASVGYVWVHVQKASYRSPLHFEDRHYLGKMTRFQFGCASQLDEARRICRMSYEILKG